MILKVNLYIKFNFMICLLFCRLKICFFFLNWIMELKKIYYVIDLRIKRGICNLWILKLNVELIFLNIKCIIFIMVLKFIL